MLRKLSGIFLILLLLSPSAKADKSKKAYELIYQDIQLIKQKIFNLEKKIDKNTEDIENIKNQLQEVISQLKLFQAEQAAFKEELKTFPDHYRVLLEKMEELYTQVIKISEELIIIKSASLQALSPPEEKLPEEQTTPPTESPETPDEETEMEQPEEKPKPVPITISPQEVYNMAYSDYLKGNYQLAIDGFKIYREQFSESPLADNAQYWIGECYFSQEKYEDAVEEFNVLILNYPGGDKIPAAYLKKGISLMKLNKKEEALVVFKLLVSKYPLSEETKIAQQKIKELLSEDERYQQSE